MTPRCACGQPAPNAVICTTCERDLLNALRTITGDGDYEDSLAYDLDIALARQAVLGDRSPARGHSASLPYDPRVAMVADHLRGVLSGWVRVLTEAGT